MNYYEQGRREALMKLGFPITPSMNAWGTVGGAAAGGLLGAIAADPERVGVGTGALVGAAGGALGGYHALQGPRSAHIFESALVPEIDKARELRKQLMASGPELLGTAAGGVAGYTAADEDTPGLGILLGSTIGGALGHQGARALDEVGSFTRDVKAMRAARAARRAEPFKVVNVRPATPRALPETTKLSFASPGKALAARIAAGAAVGGGAGALLGPTYGEENDKYTDFWGTKLNKNRFKEQTPERIKELRLKGLLRGALLGGAVSGGSKAMSQANLRQVAQQIPITEGLVGDLNKGFW